MTQHLSILSTDQNIETAQGAKSRITDLIEITHSLADIFAQENDLLTTRRAGDIASLQGDKAKLATAYASAIKDIAENKPKVENVGEQLLEKLREITANFNKLASEQKILLTAAHNASADIVQAISDEASGANPQSKTYTNNYTDQGAKQAYKNPVIVSINESA